MNQAGVFGSDVNFVPGAAVYPTAPGGTLAGAAGAMNQNTNSVVNTATGAAPVTMTATPASGKTRWYWIGLVLLLVAMVIVARKAGSEEDFRNLKPTMYNFLAITLTAIVGISGLKVLAVKFPVPGASDLILSV